MNEMNWRRALFIMESPSTTILNFVKSEAWRRDRPELRLKQLHHY